MKRLGVLAIPAALASTLPVLGCPLCWPAYAGLLSSLGVGFLASARYLLPLTISLLAVALAGLGVQARRRGYALLVLGVVASGIIMLGKFRIDSTMTTFAGVMLLLATSALALLRDRRERSAVCVDCAAPKAPASGADRPVSAGISRANRHRG
jgi:hypothetical protein